MANAKFEIFTDNAGEFRWNLKAPNHEIIAVSQGYKSKASCKNGIRSVQDNAAKAEVVDNT